MVVFEFSLILLRVQSQYNISKVHLQICYLFIKYTVLPKAPQLDRSFFSSHPVHFSNLTQIIIHRALETSHSIIYFEVDELNHKLGLIIYLTLTSLIVISQTRGINYAKCGLSR